MEIIDGKKIAAEIKEELKQAVAELIKNGKNVPGLVTILVGDNPASESYVKSKANPVRKSGCVQK